jgi:tetratricopeptide (TPR) repeat protein
MTEATSDTLDPRLRKQVQNAEKAIANGNPGYAIPVCIGILKQNPAALEVRKVLRKAQMQASGGASRKGMTKFLNKVSQAPFRMMGGRMAEKDPEKAMQQAETALTTDPRNTAAHNLLGLAAEAMEDWETAVFAYQSIRELEPDNLDNLKSLGAALVETGRNKEAIKVSEKILKEAPGDPDGQDIIKRASVSQTVDRGYEEGKSFREGLKDTKETEEIEAATASMTDEEAIENLVEKEKEKIAAEPEDVNAYKQIVNLYRRIKKPKQALEWIQKARQLDQGKTDVTLERIENVLQVEVMRQEIEQRREEAEADPENQEKQAALEKALKEEREYRLKQARSMVERYPNELAYRYELGELLYEDGEIDEAIKQFQSAQRNAKVRISSLYYLGLCFKNKQIYDLAIEQFETAQNEISQMDDTKKNIIYELADCHEKKGDSDKAIAEFKRVYAADIGFRDVADKIDAYYAQQ